jgi:hypothetical protein
VKNQGKEDVEKKTRDTVKKQTKNRDRNRNREGENLALASQHTFAIVFFIKLQHQGDT